MRKIIIEVLALVIIAGGVFSLMHKSSNKSVMDTNTSSGTTTTPKVTSNNQPSASKATTQTQATSSPATSTTTPTAPAPKATTTPSPLNATVNANDDSASPETISASNGQTVNITFNVEEQGTYHGGLEFKSTDPAIDSGPIAMGSSKVVSFTANKSFKFTPFWYASSVQKDYFVTVNVQ